MRCSGKRNDWLELHARTAITKAVLQAGHPQTYVYFGLAALPASLQV
jgi:hypothetical protein